MSAIAAAASAPAYAQEESIQEVVVTGTRIQRQDYESASPIVTVGEQAFEQTGTTTVETLLNTLPQFVPSVTNTSNNPSNGGQANVELRGLGTSRTLVLLDGKRIVPANGTGVVDLNLLPASLIQNVEIITGGASAVYGSDAVAGVVNFKTKDVEGISVESNWGQTSESDGEEWQVAVTGGTKFAGGRGKIVANLAYADRSAVLADSRQPSRVPLGYDPDDGFFPLGSPTILEGSVTVAASQAAVDQVFSGYGVPAGAVATRIFAFNQDGTLFSTGDGDTPGSVRNFRGDITDGFSDRAYTYNFAPTNYLQLPLERKSAFARASFEVTETAEVYLQGIWANYNAFTQLAPTPASSMFVPVTNPFMPAALRTLAQSRANPNANLSLTKRLGELGPRFEDNEYDVYQLISGVQGDLFGGAWNYDVYGSMGEVNVDNTQLGSISRTRFEELTFAADGGRSICGGFNPFGQGSISAECADYVKVDALNKTEVKQTIGEAVLSGPLFDLPAGKVQAAFGAFYKKDEFSFVADDKLRARTTGAFGLPVRTDVAGFNASNNTIGETDSTELYTEVLVPVLADMPGVEKLDVTLGYRYADYSTVGGVNSYKTELTYQPASAVVVRSSYQRAVRAPNIQELYQPQVTNFPAVSPPDPCSFNSPERTGANAAAVRALCLAQGLPADIINTFTFTAAQVEGLSGGNPDLGEETADTLTVGLVFRSPFDHPLLSSLQASVDWYRMEIQDAIAAVSAGTFVDRCYDPQYNPGLSADNFYCGFFTRNAFNGQITAAAELQQNIGAVETSGVDLQIDWAADAGPGRLGINWVAAWLDRWDQQELPGDAFTEYGGTIGSTIGTAFPDWKWTFNATYAIAGVSLNARWRYVGSMNDEGEPDFEVPSVDYFDAGASYSFTSSALDGLVLRMGVTNLTDKEPEIFPNTVQSNTDPSTYDVLGRRYFISANYSF